jgi:hypothetical protein
MPQNTHFPHVMQANLDTSGRFGQISQKCLPASPSPVLRRFTRNADAIVTEIALRAARTQRCAGDFLNAAISAVHPKTSA